MAHHSRISAIPYCFLWMLSFGIDCTISCGILSSQSCLECVFHCVNAPCACFRYKTLIRLLEYLASQLLGMLYSPSRPSSWNYQRSHHRRLCQRIRSMIWVLPWLRPILHSIPQLQIHWKGLDTLAMPKESRNFFAQIF